MTTISATDKITLRELCSEDAADIFHAIDTQRPYLDRWLPFVASTLRQEDSAQFVAATLAADPYEYVFTLRDQDRFIGLAGFRSSDHSTHTTEIGYWLSEAEQGQGIMTCAVRRLCRFAFEELHMKRIVIRCATGNVPSNRIPLRLGFHLTGIEPHGELLTGGDWVDLNIYTIDRGNFMTKENEASQAETI